MVEKRRLVIHLRLFLLLLTACAGQPAPVETEPPNPTPDNPNVPTTPGAEEPVPNPYAPGKGDEALQRAEVFIDSQEILILESFPPQFRLKVTGSLPTPCHELRAVVDEPNEQSQIHVQIYSLVDPDKVCTQVLEPFEVSLSLGSFASGSYMVFVNGEKVGEIAP